MTGIRNLSGRPHDSGIQVWQDGAGLGLRSKRSTFDRAIGLVITSVVCVLPGVAVAQIAPLLPKVMDLVPFIYVGVVGYAVYFLGVMFSTTELHLHPEEGWWGHHVAGVVWWSRKLRPCRVHAELQTEIRIDKEGRSSTSRHLALRHGTKTYKLFRGMSDAELEWLVDVINSWSAIAV